jgi:LmbE family N-acetylglucosaminyl deacetylase
MIEVDISKYLNIKLKAINEYKSQISIISVNQKRAITSEMKLVAYKRGIELFYVD